MTSHAQRGFTLVEVAAAIALLGVFTTAAWTLTRQAMAESEQVAGYCADLQAARAALGRIAADLRTASHAANEPAGVRIEGADGEVEFWLQDGVLWRCLAGQRERVARRIAAVSVTRCEGAPAAAALFDVEVALQTRRRTRDAAAAAWFRTAVRSRLTGDTR